MKTYTIVIDNHDVSIAGYEKLLQSSATVKNDFAIEKFQATVPETVEPQMKEFKLKWNYPWSGSVLDPWTELRKSAYGERDPLRRIACSLSHFRLWKMSQELDEPILVLEHDSEFTVKLDAWRLLDSSYGVIGINDPCMATFSYHRYSAMIQSRSEEIQPVPMLTSKEIPQGLPGNSAYLIKPAAASHLVALCYKYGLWPNDAIMCQQLCKDLAVSRTYYTRVQNLRSTTTS